ncbi:Pycsar system effector family protein [Sphingosinicella rhizophila]|uniref:DUF5706 domain-containing protein n=1 Tax=Sphingosinicella rhizophila TaxID=3050082 RepID=A0ABU3Q588_9SPHN|nr:Pycsar system effector family protein [Sphingosinicella sp. GR2756]MDT9598576.1 DUF5706 domain-containing protein [Sphingosinicella sp. GR2756]
MSQTDDSAQPPVSSKPPIGHPDYEFPKEVHNLLVVAQTTHVELSSMADSKASILMGAAYVVFSLTLGEITSNKATVPMLVLFGFSFAATVLSVIAIRPKIMKPSKKSDARTNFLFFGSFANIGEEEYIDHVIDTLRTEESAYRAMARDLYQNGRVLNQRKYKYLSHSYAVFLIGIVATMIAFLWEYLAKA